MDQPIQWGDVTRVATPSYVITHMQPFGDAGGEKPAGGDNFRFTGDDRRSTERFPKRGSELDSGSYVDEPPRPDSGRGGANVGPAPSLLDSSYKGATVSDALRPGSIQLWQDIASRCQPMSDSEHLSWYQRQMMNKRLGVGSSAAGAAQALWPRSGPHCFPDSSLGSASDHEESDPHRLVLCQQATLNKRRFSPRPLVLAPHPGAHRAAKKPTPDYPASVNTVTEEKITPAVGGRPIPVGNNVQGECQSSAEKLKDVLKKPHPARRKRARREPARKVKKKEPCLAAASKEDNTIFSQVSPWDTFSSVSRGNDSDNESTVSVIDTAGRGAKRPRVRSALKRKSPAPYSRNKSVRNSARRGFQSLAETSKTLSARKKDTVPSCSSATGLSSDVNGVREERSPKRQRYYESRSQRLKNIACCRALPAPPVAQCESKLPRIKFPGVCDEGNRVTLSLSISDLDPTPWPDATRDASCSKFTTLIEAVRVVDKARGRKNNRSPKSRPPWAAHGTGDVTPRENGIFWSSRPTSAATNTDNNASDELSPTKPKGYNAVELLRKFRENLSSTRGKGLAAAPRNDAAHSRKPFSIKSIMRSLRKTQKQCALVPMVSYISYDAELAVMKPMTRLTRPSKESSRSRTSFRNEATNSRLPSKTRNRGTKPRKTKQHLFKKIIYV